MALVEITAAEQHDGGGGPLVGCRLDGPKPQMRSDLYGFELIGWVLAEAGPVEKVEVLQEGRVVGEAEPRESRPDIAAAFPDVPHGEACGFRVPISALDLRQEFALALVARGPGERRARIADISGERATLPAGGEDLIQPLMVNTIGRSGSTWLVWLLSCLSEAVAFSPWARDARVGTYWTSVMQALSRPQSYLAQLVPGPLEQRYWWNDRADLRFGVGGDPELEGWLGGEAVESLVDFSRSRIDAFYARLGADGVRPRYFVEKYLPYQLTPDLLGEMYPGAREVILVRDFRDMLCSVIAFNRKRGYQAFGRADAGSDAEYVETTVANSARRLLRRRRERGGEAHLVRYEDLIEEPAETLGAIMRYLGLDAGEGAVTAVLERAEEGSLDEHRTTSKVSESIGRWRRDLSPELAQVCAEVLDPVLTEFGYEPTLALASEG
ncbi:MAG TPA: sulfotransferase [Solirubrobacterales bacterium]|nr:sulfotransferase [Solirubrobacterales bacterium]